MATISRPIKKWEPAEWFSRQHVVSSNAEKEQRNAVRIQNEVQFLKNETDNRAKWGQYETNVRLADRIDNVRKWKDKMEIAFNNIETELKALNDAKFDLEYILEGFNTNIDVNTECLTLRDSRRDVDNVFDDAESELKHESELIADVTKRLQNKISEDFHQLCSLQEARREIISCLDDKDVTLKIDIDHYNLGENSTGNTYKPNRKRTPNFSGTIHQWEDTAFGIIDHCNEGIDKSQRLRESSRMCSLQVDSDLKAQNDAVNFALRKRVHELSRALEELKRQKERLQKGIKNLEKELHGLEEAIRAKIPALKMAETRLENRSCRPNLDRCHDCAQENLQQEFDELYKCKDVLEKKQADARDSLHRLQKQLQEVDHNIAIKIYSQEVDNGCLDIRHRLYFSPLTKTKNGLSSLKIIREKSKVVQ